MLTVSKPAPPRIFLSHAGEDKEAASEFFAEMERLGLDYFTSSLPYGREVIGSAIEAQMTVEIHKADFVVIFVTKSSTQPCKSVIQGEVREALAQSFEQEGRLLAIRFRGEKHKPASYWKVSRVNLLEICRAYPDYLRPLPGERSGAAPARGDKCRSGGQPLPLPKGEGTDLWAVVLKGKETLIPIYSYGQDVYFDATKHNQDEPSVWEKFTKELVPSVAVLLRARAKSSLLGHFSQLEGKIHDHVDRIEPGCFTRLGQTICEKLKVPWRRPLPRDPRLPLHEKLRAELWTLPEFERQLLLRQADLLRSRLVHGSWREALLDLHALDRLLLRFGHDSYYTKILEAVCLLQLRDWHEAEHILAATLSRDDKTEHTHALLARVCWEFGRPAATLCHARAAVQFCEAKAEADPAPAARLQRLQYALQLRDDVLDGRHPELASEVEDALQERHRIQPDHLQHFTPDDRIKYRIACARHDRVPGRTNEALAEATAILQEVQARVSLPSAVTLGFPARLPDSFFAELAAERLFFGPAVRITGEVDAFHVVEGEQAWQFRSTGDDSYELRFRSLDLVTECFELALQISPDAQRKAALEMENLAILLENARGYENAAIAWCELADYGAVLRVCERGLQILPDHPPLLYYAAVACCGIQQMHRACHFADACLMSCRERLITARTDANLTPAEIIRHWAKTKALLGDEHAARAAAALIAPLA